MQSSSLRCFLQIVLLPILALSSPTFAQERNAFDLKASSLEATVGQQVDLSVTRPSSDSLCAVEFSFGDGKTQKRRLGVGENSFTERYSFSKPGTYQVMVTGATQMRGLGNIATACPGDDRHVTINVREVAATTALSRSANANAAPSPSIAATTASAPMAKGRRVALIIGNSDYQFPNNLPKLPNPVNDAEDIATALRGFGFEVIERKNQTLEGMNSAVAEFGRKLNGSDAAFFYFAGHGIQVKNQNYLMPVNAKIESEPAVPYEGFDINRVLDEMDNAKSSANIVMLDACRNNPISGKFRSGRTRGLASPGPVPTGTILVYATDPGNVAADGDGRNGLFTAGLLNAFKGGDLSLDGVLTVASEYVEKKSLESDPTHKQTPYVNGPKTLQKNFHFGVTVEPGDGAIEKTFWTSIEHSNDPANFESYLRQYPKGSYRTLAENHLKRLKPSVATPTAAAAASTALAVRPAAADDAETSFWKEVKASGEKSYYEAYLKQYPKGKYPELARIELKKLEEKEKAEKVKEEAERKRVAEQERLAKEKAQREETERMRQEAKAAAEQERQETARREKERQEAEHWQRASNAKDIPTVQGYLDRFPSGRFISEAKAKLEAMKKVEAGLVPGTVFKDCPDCPEMVVLNKSIAMGRTEVTQRQWELVMGTNLSEHRPCSQCPVENVSWIDATSYLKELTDRTGKQYRLPTEQEWERACRPGEYCGGDDDIGNVAWYNGNSGSVTHPVAGKKPNSKGLYDMAGNVMEWTESCYSGNCEWRVIRGGTYGSYPDGAGARSSTWQAKNVRSANLGFRPVRMLP